MRTVVAVAALSLLMTGVSTSTAHASDQRASAQTLAQVATASSVSPAASTSWGGTTNCAYREEAFDGTTQYIAIKSVGGCWWNPGTGIKRVEYLVVGGGGAGGVGRGGGGGAGGVVSGSLDNLSNVDYFVSVGNGGASVTGDLQGNSGQDSQLHNQIAKGGGGGGGASIYWNGSVFVSRSAGLPGGSGGGAAGNYVTWQPRNPGDGTPGQGNRGGWYSPVAGQDSYAGGGGGGAGAVGADGITAFSAGGRGGDGLAGWLPASVQSTLGVGQEWSGQVYFAGGGGGTGTGSSGDGGLGGGRPGCSTGNCDNRVAGTGWGNTGGGGGASEGAAAWSGAGGSGVVILRFSTVPGAPTGVTATAGQNSANVSWSAPSYIGTSAITQYTVTSSGGHQCTPVPATATSCTVNGLPAGTPYTFTVTATSSQGTGPASSASSTITPFGPLDRFAVTTTSNTAIGNQTYGAAFNIRITAQDSGGRTVTTFTGTVDITSTATISSGGGTTGSFSDGVLSSRSITLTTAGAGQTITATQTGGSVSGTSAAFTVSASAPGQPTDVTAVVGEGQATVSWTAPVNTGGSTITGYTVSASPGGATCNPSPADATSCVVTGLTPGTSYTFSVTASNATATGSASTPSSPIVPYGALAKFAVTATDGNPVGPQTAGQSFTIMITAQDSAGRTYTDFTGSVNITSTSSISFGGGQTQAFTSGVLPARSIILVTAGAGQTITATETGGAITGTSAAFAVSASSTVSSLQRLSTGSQTAMMGSAVADPMVVLALDQYGNAVPSAPITFTVTAGGGFLGAAPGATSVTVNTDASGVATSPAWTLGTTVGALNNTLEARNGSKAVTTLATAIVRPIEITASTSSITYPAVVSQSYAITSGMLGGDDSISSVTYLYTGTGSTTYGPLTTAPLDAGTYLVTPTAVEFSPGAAVNYTITYQSGTIAIAEGTQTITFAAIADDTYGVVPIVIAPTASSQLPVTVTSNSPSVCTATSTAVTIVGTGTCSLTATQPGTVNYPAASPVTRTFSVSKAAQTPLAIVSDDSVPFGTPAMLMTTGGSGTGALGVTVADGTASGCTLTGSSLASSSIGTCVITASKPGDDNYLPTTTVTKTVTITAASQTISFTTSPPLVPRPLGTYAVAASATSGLPVSLAVTTGLGTVCSISGSGPTATVTFAASGQCVITATQAGNGNINPAPSATQTIDVGKLNQAITFAQPADRDFGSSAFALSSTASSGLPVRFALDGTSTTNSSCSVDDTGIVTINAVGACGITVTQAGNAAYAAASPVTRVFQVRVAAASAPYITGVNVQNGGATLTFAVPGFSGGAPIAGYQVNAYPAGGGAPVMFNGCPTTLPLECTMQGLTNGVGYRFTVQAINPAGAGAESPLVPAANQSPITSAIRPAAVSGLIAVRGNTTLQALWDPLTVAQLGGGSFTEYRVSIALASGGGSFFDDTLGSQSDDSYTFTGLTNGVHYVITIVAITQANSAAMEGNTATVTEIPARVPDAVMGMYVPTSGTTGIVSWSPPVSDGGSPVLEYRVELTSGGTTVVALTLGAGVFSTPVTGLTRGATYAVRMTVVNAVGPTDVTHNSTQPNVPTAPVITNATPVTVDDSRGFEVTWTAPADNGAPITGYQVTATKRSAMSSLSVRAASVDDTQFTCTSSTTDCVMFAPGSVRDYAFIVVADNLAGLSDPSAPFVVPDPTPPGPGPGPGPIPPGPTPPGPQPLPGPVAPGELVIEVDGRPDGSASGGPNSTGDGLQVTGPSYSVSIRALDAQRLPVPLGERDSLVAYTRQRLQVSGEGFQPATYAAVYVMNPVLAGFSNRALTAPVRLGIVFVGSVGTFTGSWVLPPSVSAGQYVLQVVGTLSRGSLLSVDTGLTVKNVDRRSITIAGQRVRQAKPAQVKVFGRAWDLNGVKATARVKLQGQTKYSTGSSRVIRDGEFTWQRKTAKKVYVYFQADGVRSQRVIIDSQRR